MPDLDYAKLTGRLALTVGDGGDVGEDPDTIWCDEGTVRIKPLNTYTKVAGGTPVPFTAGHAVIDCTVDSEGYITWNGQRQVYVVDLTSDKVNPQIGAGLATHEVTFLDVKAGGTPVVFEKMQVRLTALGPEGDGENDLTIVSPVSTGTATPIVVGPAGPEGPPGPASTVPGPAGDPGSKWLSGAGAPAGGTGVVTDWYLDTTTDDVYEKTGASTWTLRANIKGATGADGPAGVTGPAGRGISTVARTTGTGAPGTTDVYTITYSDATTSTFSVYNGADGAAGGGGGTSLGDEVMFSSLVGADDDAKLASFMATQAALTMKGKTLVLDEARTYTFTQQQTLYNGFSIRGTHRPQDQARSSLPLANRVNLRMTGGPKGWFLKPAGSTFGVSITNLSIDGDINSYLVEGHASGVLWTSVFRDISIQNALGVLGQPSQKLLVTACTIDGWWDVNNVRSRAFHVGGSDFYFQPSMMLLDTEPSMLAASGYLISYDYMSNSWLSNVYCTAEEHAAFSIAGSNASGGSVSNWIKDCVWEGRNEGQPALGSLIRINGGQYGIKDCRFANAMFNPAGTGRDDGGVIHITNGTVTIDGCSYNLATGVDADVPFIYVAGGNVRVRNISAMGYTSGRKPLVYAVTEGLVDADNSVEVFIPTVPEALTGAGNVTTAFTNTGTTITCTKPANIANDDLLVALVFARNNSAPYTTVPSGWTEVAPTTDATGPGLIRFYYKPISNAAGEPADYTWSGGSSGRNNVIMFRVIGADLVTPIGVKSTVATAISGPYRIIIPSVTTTAPASLLLLGGSATTSSGGGAYYSNAGVTVVGTETSETGAAESATTVAQKTVASGATGTTSWLSSIDGLSTGNGYAITINGVF